MSVTGRDSGSGPKDLKSRVVLVDLPTHFISTTRESDLKDEVLRPPPHLLNVHIVQGSRTTTGVKLLVTGSVVVRDVDHNRTTEE